MGAGPGTAEPGKVLASRARARSTGPLRFHTDRCDVVAPALRPQRHRPAASASWSASRPSATRCSAPAGPARAAVPGLLPDAPGRGGRRERRAIYAMPVFAMRDGRFTSQYSRTFVEAAQKLPGVPRLTAAQDEALDLLAEVARGALLRDGARAGRHPAPQQPRHLSRAHRLRRTTSGGRDRLLLRLWLAMPNSRALPAGLRGALGQHGPGAVRGGTPQADGRRSLARRRGGCARGSGAGLNEDHGMAMGLFASGLGDASDLDPAGSGARPRRRAAARLRG